MDTKLYEDRLARRSRNNNTAVSDAADYKLHGSVRLKREKKSGKKKNPDSRDTTKPKVRELHTTNKTPARIAIKMRDPAVSVASAELDAQYGASNPEASHPVLRPLDRSSTDFSSTGLLSLPLDIHGTIFSCFIKHEETSDFLRAISRCRRVSSAYRDVVEQLMEVPQYWDVRVAKLLRGDRFSSSDEKQYRSARVINELGKKRSPFKSLGSRMKKNQALSKTSDISLNFAKIAPTKWKSAIRAASQMKNCRVLHLDANGFTPWNKMPTHKILSCVKKMQVMKRENEGLALPEIFLDLGQCIQKKEDFEELASALSSNSLISKLSLTLRSHGDADYLALVGAIRNSKVRALVLSTPPSDEDVAKLAAVFKGESSLDSVTLNGYLIECDGMVAMADGIRESQSLKTLKLKVNPHRPKDLVKLAQALAVNSSLLELELTGGVMTLDVLDAMAEALQKNSNLKLLVLKDCEAEKSVKDNPELRNHILRLQYDPRVRIVGKLTVRDAEGMLGEDHFVPEDSEDARQNQAFLRRLRLNSSLLG